MAFARGGRMKDKQLENLYKIKDLCCEKMKHCYQTCYYCNAQCIEYKILTLVNEVTND